MYELNSTKPFMCGKLKIHRHFLTIYPMIAQIILYQIEILLLEF